MNTRNPINGYSLWQWQRKVKENKGGHQSVDVGLKPPCKCAANSHPVFERGNMKGEEFFS